MDPFRKYLQYISELLMQKMTLKMQLHFQAVFVNSKSNKNMIDNTRYLLQQRQILTVTTTPSARSRLLLTV